MVPHDSTLGPRGCLLSHKVPVYRRGKIASFKTSYSGATGQQRHLEEPTEILFLSVDGLMSSPDSLKVENWWQGNQAVELESHEDQRHVWQRWKMLGLTGGGWFTANRPCLTLNLEGMTVLRCCKWDDQRRKCESFSTLDLEIWCSPQPSALTFTLDTWLSLAIQDVAWRFMWAPGVRVKHAWCRTANCIVSGMHESMKVFLMQCIYWLLSSRAE